MWDTGCADLNEWRVIPHHLHPPHRRVAKLDDHQQHSTCATAGRRIRIAASATTASASRDHRVPEHVIPAPCTDAVTPFKAHGRHLRRGLRAREAGSAFAFQAIIRIHCATRRARASTASRLFDRLVISGVIDPPHSLSAQRPAAGLPISSSRRATAA
jgi:hypothetical protein